MRAGEPSSIRLVAEAIAAMEKPNILHLFTPAAAGEPVRRQHGLRRRLSRRRAVHRRDACATSPRSTQDAIFSRGPEGREAHRPLHRRTRSRRWRCEMLDAAKKAMVPPFEVSVFADPSGAFTTAAAAVACVEKTLKSAFATALAGKRVLVLGATGPVGAASAVLAAQARCASAGCQPQRPRSREAGEPHGARALQARSRAGAGRRAAALEKLVGDAEVIIAAAKAGVEVLPAATLAKPRTAGRRRCQRGAAAGIAGIGVQDNGERWLARRAQRRRASARLLSATSSTRSSAGCSRRCSARRKRCIWIS